MVGIALGSAGTAIAAETADAALTGDDLAKLPDAIALARFSRRVVRQNRTTAPGTTAVLAPLSPLGHTHPGVAVLFHEGSTVLIVPKALRLLAFKPR
jgi:Cd2+/Zn2+-exporting ATPase